MIKIPRRKKAFKETSDKIEDGRERRRANMDYSSPKMEGSPIRNEDSGLSNGIHDETKGQIILNDNNGDDNQGIESELVREGISTETSTGDKLDELRTSDEESQIVSGIPSNEDQVSRFRQRLSDEASFLDEGHGEDNLSDGDIDKIRMELPIESTEAEEGGILRDTIHNSISGQGSDSLNVHNRRARRKRQDSGHGTKSDKVHNGLSVEAIPFEAQETGSGDNLDAHTTAELERSADKDIHNAIYDETEQGDKSFVGRTDGISDIGEQIDGESTEEVIEYRISEEQEGMEDNGQGTQDNGTRIRNGDDGLGDKSDNNDILTEEDLENIIDDNSEPPEEVLEPEIVIDSVEPVEEEPKKKDTLQELNEERKYQKKLDVIKFLKEYSKSISRPVDDVSAKMHIHSKTGRNYLNEYIDLVKETVTNQTYPLGVLQHYNEGIDDDEKRLKFWHTDQLRDLVKRYSKYDINASLDPDRNKTLNSDHNDTFISKNSVAHSDDNLSLLGSHQQQSQQQLVQPMGNDIYNDIDAIHDGITSLQLIRFGLSRVFGQQARTKIGEMMGTNVTPYLMDEQKMHKLLRMFAISEARCADFIDWLKTNAKYVNHPEGFLSYGAPAGGTNPGIPMSNYSVGVSNGNGQPDLMTDYYYKMGIYQAGFPPDHPINRESLRDYKQQEAENKQMKSLDQKINMYVRTKMLDAFDGSGGKNGQGNSLFSPEMMLMMGMAEYRQVRDENGNVTWTLTPKMMGAPNGMAGSANPTDQMTGMMAMMKEMMGFMASMQKNNTDPMQQNFMGTVMTALASKLTEQPQSKIQEVVGIAEMLQKLKGPDNPNANMGAITDPDVIIKTKRMDLDKEFGMRRLDLQEKELQLQRDRLQMQDKEANQNLQTLLEGIQSFAPMVVNMVQQFIMGNKGSAAAVGGAPVAQPQQNPADLLLKMEYQKQQQRMAEEQERKRREWEEEMRRKNETERMYQNYQPARPEAERVVIKEVPVKAERHTEEHYDESKFTPYSPQELESALEEADKNIRKLEAYKATVGNVLQNKLLNGDSEMEVIEPPMPVVQRQIVQKEEPKNVGEMLDNYPEGMLDPDFDGVEREEEVEIVTDDNEHANIVSDVGDKNEAEDVEI